VIELRKMVETKISIVLWAFPNSNPNTIPNSKSRTNPSSTRNINPGDRGTTSEVKNYCRLKAKFTYLVYH